MDRLDAFEAMLQDIVRQSEMEREKMDALKAAGRENLRPTASILQAACCTNRCWISTSVTV